jgi:hypothetical protein
VHLSLIVPFGATILIVVVVMTADGDRDGGSLMNLIPLLCSDGKEVRGSVRIGTTAATGAATKPHYKGIWGRGAESEVISPATTATIVASHMARSSCLMMMMSVLVHILVV